MTELVVAVVVPVRRIHLAQQMYRRAARLAAPVLS